MLNYKLPFSKIVHEKSKHVKLHQTPTSLQNTHLIPAIKNFFEQSSSAKSNVTQRNEEIDNKIQAGDKTLKVFDRFWIF